jgi:hypothetical protein
MRLIDGDALIEKFNEKAGMAECLIDARTAERFATFCALAETVEQMPTIDAVSVVRCKDCKQLQCCNYTQFLGVDGYCSYGEYKRNTEGIK